MCDFNGNRRLRIYKHSLHVYKETGRKFSHFSESWKLFKGFRNTAASADFLRKYRAVVTARFTLLPTLRRSLVTSSLEATRRDREGWSSPKTHSLSTLFDLTWMVHSVKSLCPGDI